jgi:hypothetical protein
MQSIQMKLTVMLMLAGLVLTCPAAFQAFGSDSKFDRETLHGLQGVHVVVENIDQNAERDGLTEHQVQTDVELRLRQSGIRVLSEEERLATPGRPYLYINVNTFKNNDMEFYVYSITVELNQNVWLSRNCRDGPQGIVE